MPGILKPLKYYRYFRNHLYIYPIFVQELFYRMLGKRRVMFAEIFFDSHCNFRCWHCSSLEYTKGRAIRSLDLEQLRHVLTQLRSIGVLSVSLVGGEPTLRKDLPDIIRLTNSLRILPSIITNASLLTRARVDELYEAGLANMSFSLQSFDALTHDSLVNHPGAYDSMMAMIRYCLDRKYPISICTVPTNENLANGDFGQIVSFARKHAVRINANLPAPIGEFYGKEDTVMLSRESIDLLYREYFPLENFLPDFKQSSLAEDVRCPMGENLVYVFPDGEVCPCTFAQISFGNVLKEPLRDILARMDASRTLAELDRNQCPIGMDKEFVAKVGDCIRTSDTYPPRGDKLGF